jgi:hypothetical protein
LTEAKLAVSCEIRSKTENPCRRRAVVEMRGVAFCEPCAREQEAYFAIGELTQDETQGSGSKLLVEAPKRLRRESRNRTSRPHERLTSENRLCHNPLSQARQNLSQDYSSWYSIILPYAEPFTS